MLAVPAHDHVGRQVMLAGRYERDELALLLNWLRAQKLAGGLALDVGANLGNHTLALAEAFDEVWAFEPSPRTHSLLRFNTERLPQVRRFELALSDRQGEASLQVPEDNLGMASLQLEVGGPRYVVSTLPLDALPEVSERRVALIKLDVEGHEAAVLRGAEQLLLRDRPVLVFEQLAREIDADGSSEVLRLLRAAGYSRLLALEVWPDSGSRSLNLLLRLLCGRRLRLMPVQRLARREHTMVVALA